MRHPKGTSANVSTSNTITPPFGLKWGENAERLEKLLTGAKATIVNRETKGEIETWEVQGLIQSGLKSTNFELRKGQLVGVTLVYVQPDWPAEKYLSQYATVRDRIASRFAQPAREITGAAAEGEQMEGEQRKLREAEWRREEGHIRLVYLQGREGEPKRALKVVYGVGMAP
jgi:hypothetical protein